MKENSYGKRLGRVWSQYSYIFVLLIIMIGYAYTVFINGKQAGRIGDPVSCGGEVAEGSGDVFIGG